MFKVIIDLAEDEKFMPASFAFATYEAATSFVEDALAHQEENYSYTIEETEK